MPKAYRYDRPQRQLEELWFDRLTDRQREIVNAPPLNNWPLVAIAGTLLTPPIATSRELTKC